MGRLAVEDMLEHADFERALAWHLSDNCFPSIPEVFDAAVLAITEARYENWDGLIPLPAGVTWRGDDMAPVWACLEGWHLEAFVYAERVHDDDWEVE